MRGTRKPVQHRRRRADVFGEHVRRVDEPIRRQRSSARQTPAREVTSGVHNDSPSLVWVLVDGAPRHVAEFARLPSRSRPRARCPQCGRGVTLKLGPVLRHHAAHAPGDVCAATRPETALHVNCKLALATALRAATGTDAELAIVRHCAGGGEACDERRVDVWTRGWDAVSLEERVGASRRPDVVLHRDGTPIGAIEIVVSNAVSPDKARALDALGIPWIEVPASDALALRDGWSVRAPLDVARTSAGGGRRVARVVDVYHDGGVRERFIYSVTESLTDGCLDAVQLQRGRIAVAVIPVASAGDLRARAWPLIREALGADLERFSRGAGSFTDSPMRWAKGDAAENIVGEALTDFAGRDPTPLATRYPRRWFYARERARWFLPPDMRDVRWDREPLDPFAAHPAWSRQRGEVRERPAPEGSWSTPVFASPPIAAMFRDCVRSVERAAGDAIGIVEVAIALDNGAARRRVVVVLERAVADDAVTLLAERLAAERVDAVWVSSPWHWIPALAAVAWAPAGRDWYGRGGVVIDGLGVFKADQFARAWAKGDRPLRGEVLRARMAARVERLRAEGH